jgi:hypothetical protein
MDKGALAVHGSTTGADGDPTVPPGRAPTTPPGDADRDPIVPGAREPGHTATPAPGPSTGGPDKTTAPSGARPGPSAGEPASASPAHAPSPGPGEGYYAPAARVAAALVAAGLTPPISLIPGPRNRDGEFCTVEALPEVQWPPNVPWCVEVVHHPEAAYRWAPGRPEPFDGLAHRRRRLAVVAEALRAAGYTTTLVPRGGWRPGQQALHVHPPATDSA